MGRPTVAGVMSRAVEAVRSLAVLYRAGLAPIPRLDEGIRSIISTRRYGPLAGSVKIAARRRADARRHHRQRFLSAQPQLRHRQHR